jgi:hypothetical protein
VIQRDIVCAGDDPGGHPPRTRIIKRRGQGAPCMTY